MGSHFHRGPRFQPPSLKFRTSGFPPHGFKHQTPQSSVWSLPGRVNRLSPTQAFPVSTVGLLHPSEPPTSQVGPSQCTETRPRRAHLGPGVLAPLGLCCPEHPHLSTPSASLTTSCPFPGTSGYRDGLWHSRVFLPGRQTFRTFTAALSRIAALSIRRETQYVRTPVLPYRHWPSDKGGKSLASPNIPPIRSTRELDFDLTFRGSRSGIFLIFPFCKSLFALHNL